jgi:hypothetical protein
MLGFPSAARKRPSVRAPRRSAPLAVTWLETRDTPSTVGPVPAPTLSPLSGVTQPDGTVLVSGHVTDANPATVTVTVGGAASAQFHPNTAGDFGVVIQLSGNGSVITVQALDDQNLQSAAVSYDTGHPVLRVEAATAGMPTASGPTTAAVGGTTAGTTTGSGLTMESGSQNRVAVSILITVDKPYTHIGGQVNGDFPDGSHVEIVSGDQNLNGLTGDIGDDGSFQIDVSLPDGTVSNITVNIVDADGHIIGSGSGQVGW